MTSTAEEYTLSIASFYDEVLKALWGYISDKLNIPVSQLSKDNIEDELTKYGVEPKKKSPLRVKLVSPILM